MPDMSLRFAQCCWERCCWERCNRMRNDHLTVAAGHGNCLQMARDSVTASEHLREVDPDVDYGLHSDLVPEVAAEHRLGVDPEVDVGPLSDPGHGMVAEHRPGVDPEAYVDLHPARILDAAAADEDHRVRTRDCRLYTSPSPR